MATINKVIIGGHIVKEPKPEITYYENGGVRAKFKVETSSIKQKQNGGREAVRELHHCIAWRYKVPKIVDIAVEDNFVFITGSIRTVQLTDKRCKKTFPFTFIVVEDMHLLTDKDG